MSGFGGPKTPIRIEEFKTPKSQTSHVGQATGGLPRVRLREANDDTTVSIAVCGTGELLGGVAETGWSGHCVGLTSGELWTGSPSRCLS